MTRFPLKSFVLFTLVVGAQALCQCLATLNAAEYIVPENYLGVDSWRSSTPGKGHSLACGSTTIPNVYKVVHYANLNPRDPQVLTMYHMGGTILFSIALGQKPVACNFVNFYKEY